MLACVLLLGYVIDAWAIPFLLCNNNLGCVVHGHIIESLANFRFPRAPFVRVDTLLNNLFSLSFQSSSLSSCLRHLPCKRGLCCFDLSRSFADLSVCSYFTYTTKAVALGTLWCAPT